MELFTKNPKTEIKIWKKNKMKNPKIKIKIVVLVDTIKWRTLKSKTKLLFFSISLEWKQNQNLENPLMHTKLVQNEAMKIFYNPWRRFLDSIWRWKWKPKIDDEDESRTRNRWWRWINNPKSMMKMNQEPEIDDEDESRTRNRWWRWWRRWW